MIKFSSSAVLALTAVLMPVAAQAETVFEHDGQRYVYTTKETKGRTYIRGYAEKGYAPFELTVRNGRVSGTVDGRVVAFRVSDVKPAVVTQTAAR